jgi:hypothetical protein
MPNLSIYLPERVVEQIDALRGEESRGRWVRRTVEQALGGEPSGQAVKRSATPGVEAKKPVGAGATPVSPASAAQQVRRDPGRPGPAPAAPSDYEIPKIARRKP